MTVRCALYMDALKIFESLCVRPWLLLPNFVNCLSQINISSSSLTGFCSDRSYECRKSVTINALLNGTIPDPLRPPFPLGWGFATHPKNALDIIPRTAKAREFKFGTYIQRVHPSKSPWKILEKREGGRIQGLPKFLQYPYYLRNAYIYEVQIWQRPCEQKTLKIWEKRGRWRIQGLPKFLNIPYYLRNAT